MMVFAGVYLTIAFFVFLAVSMADVAAGGEVMTWAARVFVAMLWPVFVFIAIWQMARGQA
jgi:hypothetical protein